YCDVSIPLFYTFSLLDALPISRCRASPPPPRRSSRTPARPAGTRRWRGTALRRSGCRGSWTWRLGFAEETAIVAPGRPGGQNLRSEEHTSELQSRENIVCRLLL